MTTLQQRETGQVSADAAEVYEACFVPALFQDWAHRVAELARPEVGQQALDVACGTGVLSRELAARVGPEGSVTGVDLNPGMLAVARRQAPAIEWREAPAERLPFGAGSFDVVASQFGLMFFEDRRRGAREMVRVLRPGGSLTVAVWASLERNAAFAGLTTLLRRLFGSEVADAMRVPFSLGEPDALRRLFSGLELEEIEIEIRPGRARFPSIRSWIYVEVRGWTLGQRISDDRFEELVARAEEAFSPWVTRRGRVELSMPALVLTGRKPGPRSAVAMGERGFRE